MTKRATRGLAAHLQAQLREARQTQGRSQAEVAASLGVSQQMMAKLERPSYEPSLTQFERLAGALGFEVTLSLRRTRR